MTSAELRREQEDFERTLNQVEEEADAKAAKRARAEASADLAEFDEEIAYQVRSSHIVDNDRDEPLGDRANAIDRMTLGTICVCY